MQEAITLSRPRAQELVRGEFVEIRSAQDIAATLDANGKLDGLPFMPEMLPFCGQRFKVYRRADRICVEGLGFRGMSSTVFLDGVRCDGAHHDGCQRNCLIFWHEAWLRLADEGGARTTAAVETASGALSDIVTRSGERYYCQSTELHSATYENARWDAFQALKELRQGELSLSKFALIGARSIIDKIRGLAGMKPLGFLSGKSTRNSKGDLDLKPGEWVEVKSLAEIEATLDPKGKNAGLMFDLEMSIYAGKRFRVKNTIDRIILEESGRLRQLSNTVALDGIFCQGICAGNCPRANPIYWREAWLKRAPV